jgi:hypothetical protein
MEIIGNKWHGGEIATLSFLETGVLWVTILFYIRIGNMKLTAKIYPTQKKCGQCK